MTPTSPTPLRRIIGQTTAHRGKMSSSFEVAGLRESAPWMDPFLSIDHFLMSAPTFAPHPHAGFSAVTVILENSPGSIRNRDSLGTDELIPPGAVHWTQAGSGILHEEIPTASPIPCHGLQIFVALPDELELSAPRIYHLDPTAVPTVVTEGGSHVRVLCGSFDSATSSLEAPGGAYMWDVHLKPGQSFVGQPPKGHSAFAFVLAGEGVIDQDTDSLTVTQDQAAGFTDDGLIQIRAHTKAVQVLIAGGLPLKRPQVWEGGISTGTASRTADLVKNYQAGKFGSLSSSF
jgi:redox-sensitive bicupin YhaK (pirin superfamily)